MAKTLDDLQNYLQIIVAFRGGMPKIKNVKYCCPEEMILANAIPAKVKAKRPQVDEPKNCFVNAYSYSLAHPETFYTEGYFSSVVPIHHAWVTRPDGVIIDTTLGDDRGPEHYLGVPFSHAFMRRHIKNVKRQFGGTYPAVLIGPNEMFNIDILNGDFELAKVSGSKLK